MSMDSYQTREIHPAVFWVQVEGLGVNMDIVPPLYTRRVANCRGNEFNTCRKHCQLTSPLMHSRRCSSWDSRCEICPAQHGLRRNFCLQLRLYRLTAFHPRLHSALYLSPTIIIIIRIVMTTNEDESPPVNKTGLE